MDFFAIIEKKTTFLFFSKWYINIKLTRYFRYSVSEDFKFVVNGVSFNLNYSGSYPLNAILYI